MTIGADRPPYGARQRKFSPLSAQRPTSPVSGEVPSRFGPRASGQSPFATLRPCDCADTKDTKGIAAKHTKDTKDTKGAKAVARRRALSLRVGYFIDVAPLEGHSGTNTVGPRRATLADEPRRRQPWIRKRYRHLA